MIKLLFVSAALLVWDPPSNVDVIPVSRYVVYHSGVVAGPFMPIGNTIETNLILGPLNSGTNGFESDPSNQVFNPVINPPVNAVIKITIP
jgi:hypothetical protein